MAHLIEQMAYRGAVPWHGLGNTIDEHDSLEEIQRKAGLDWDVAKYPVQYIGASSAMKTFKDKYVIARVTDERPFAVVSNRYKPVQPKEILEFFRSLLSRHGMRIETAGSLKDGARIWALATTGDAHKIAGRDEIKGYLNIATSYDLTFSTVAYFTSVRVVCNNTLQQSFGDRTGTIRIPHFREFDIEAIHNQMGLGIENWKAFTEACELLNRVKLDSVAARKVLDVAFKIPADEIKAMTDPDRLHVQNVFDLFSGQRYMGADMSGDSAWGLVNAATEYIDHIKRARNQANRLDSAWFGEGYNIKQRTFDECLKLAA